jgi:hypothetical protein
LSWTDIVFTVLMLALYSYCLIVALAGSRPAKAGLVLIAATASIVFVGTRLLALNSYIGGLALLLNGFFAAIFILVGITIHIARKALK